jgi:hypothetical protein
MNDICHIIMPHHVLSDYCPKQFVYNDFKIISHFCLLTRKLVINSIIYLKIFTSITSSYFYFKFSLLIMNALLSKKNRANVFIIKLLI